MASFMRDFFEAFRDKDIQFAFASDSHANRGMNKIANGFLKSDCDAWFNIDADIRFRKQDVDNLIEHVANDVALVYGIYPKKEDATSPCLCTFETVDAPDAKTGLTKMRRAGRGFMLVRRDVLEAMKEDNGGPALRYHNHGGDIEWDFFPSGVVTGAMSALENAEVGMMIPDGMTRLNFPVDADGYRIREWISEDWYFCERARALGYPTMVDARIALGHVGLKEYRFSMDQVTRLDSHITSWKQIHGWFDYADLYRELAVKLPDGGSFVEVGCWMGKSIAFMAEELKKLKKNVALHVVDTFKGSPANPTQAEMLEAHGGSVEKIFRSNMEALGFECIDATSRSNIAAHRDTAKPAIFVLAKSSEQASWDFADEWLDAVFIDGDHSYKAVLKDIASWWPKVKSGGTLCGHDIDEPGVAEAVKNNFHDFGYEGQRLYHFDVKGRCWVVKKTKTARTEVRAV
jgi:SAM-dependent methyltransferase